MLRSSWRVRASLLLAALLAVAPVRAEPEKVDELIMPLVGKETPGLAVLVTRNGKALLAKGYGVADIESGEPVTADTIFDLASLSKQMTALLTLKLSEEGMIDLAAPLDETLDSFEQHAEYRPVTANDLVHHTGGLADYLDMWVTGTTNADVVAYASKHKPVFAPGTRYEYSNTGYVVLATALAEAGHAADFSTLLQREIFAPLGMTDTAMPHPAAGLAPERIAKGYEGENGAFAFDMDDSNTQGDGSIQSSVNDLAKYEAALAAGSIVPKATLAKLFVPGRLDDGTVIDAGDGESYGMGWELSQSEGHSIASHSGRWNGFCNYYYRDLTSGISVIVLSNNSDFHPGSLAEAIAALYGAS